MSFTGFILPGPESSGELSLHLVLVDLYIFNLEVSQTFFLKKACLI